MEPPAQSHVEAFEVEQATSLTPLAPAQGEDLQGASLEHRETQLEYHEESQSYRRRVMAPEENSELRRTGSFRATSSPDMPDYRLPRRSTDASAVDLETSVHQVGSRLSRRGTSSVEAAVSGTARRSVPFAADEDDDDNFVYATPSPKLGPSAAAALPNSSAAAGGSHQQQNARDRGSNNDFIEQASQRLFGLTKEPLPIERRIKQRVKPAVTVLQKFLRHVMFESIWLILILLGSGMSIFAWCIDEVTEVLVDWRGALAKLNNSIPESEQSSYQKWARSLNLSAAFFMWWLYATVMCMGAVLVVKYLAPQAAGSGIEQIRSIMTGYSIPGYLAVNTMVAKIVGLVLAQASGLTVGKEGPFVHISCTLGYLLVSIPLFKEIKESRHLTKQVISAAAATGVASTFGAPIGGVLFAIEVTSSVYHTSDYWKGFFTCVVGELVFRELSYFGTARTSHISLFPTTFQTQPYLMSELPLFVFLSAIMGLYGGAYVRLLIWIRIARTNVVARAEAWRIKRLAQQQVAMAEDAEVRGQGIRGGSSFGTDGGPDDSNLFDLRQRSILCPSLQLRLRRGWAVVQDYSLRVAGVLCQPLMFAVVVITLTAVINWFGPEFMQRSLYNGISDLLVSGQMTAEAGLPADDSLHSKDWGSPNLYANLFWYFVAKSFLCAIALALPVPTGTLIPMLAIGLSFGRLFGEAVQGWGGVAYAPGGYAVVGASAFIAGATGAVSTAVIVFEITSQLAYMVPVLLAVILGRAAGKVLSPDLYEALQIFKNLPNIPPLAHQSSYKVLAVEIMNPNNIPVLPRVCTVQTVVGVLNARSHRHGDHVQDDDLFAVVDEEFLYLGSIARHQLKAVAQSSHTGEVDLLTVCNLNSVAPAMPITTPVPDVLYMFEITLCSTLFVVDHNKVVGWLDLQHVKHLCESGEL